MVVLATLEDRQAGRETVVGIGQYGLLGALSGR